MSTNTRVMACRPEDVFGVLNDGWLFPVWVVGASRMRDVDDAWPQVGSHLKHSFGIWPALIDDQTTVLEYDAPRRFVIRAAGWPLGEASVVLEVQPHRKGCLVRIIEKAVKGPGALIPEPLLNIPLHMRNHETLKRLAYIAEGKADNGDAPDVA